MVIFDLPHICGCSTRLLSFPDRIVGGPTCCSLVNVVHVTSDFQRGQELGHQEWVVSDEASALSYAASLSSLAWRWDSKQYVHTLENGEKVDNFDDLLRRWGFSLLFGARRVSALLPSLCWSSVQTRVWQDFTAESACLTSTSWKYSPNFRMMMKIFHAHSSNLSDSFWFL